MGGGQVEPEVDHLQTEVEVCVVEAEAAQELQVRTVVAGVRILLAGG
ncbi:hypothetical protein UNDKW_3652 [Undibacterium sp. KW1]|nr:hypothetical protein UNDKW_3652 [Undibacterium sp. KW1]